MAYCFLFSLFQIYKCSSTMPWQLLLSLLTVPNLQMLFNYAMAYCFLFSLFQIYKCSSTMPWLIAFSSHSSKFTSALQLRHGLLLSLLTLPNLLVLFNYAMAYCFLFSLFQIYKISSSMPWHIAFSYHTTNNSAPRFKDDS